MLASSFFILILSFLISISLLIQDSLSLILALPFALRLPMNSLFLRGSVCPNGPLEACHWCTSVGVLHPFMRLCSWGSCLSSLLYRLAMKLAWGGAPERRSYNTKGISSSAILAQGSSALTGKPGVSAKERLSLDRYQEHSPCSENEIPGNPAYPSTAVTGNCGSLQMETCQEISIPSILQIHTMSIGPDSCIQKLGSFNSSDWISNCKEEKARILQLFRLN